MSKAARTLVVVRREGKLFNCPLVLKNCFNSYVLLNLDNYCAQCGWRVYWIVLFAMRKSCAVVNFVVWGTEGMLMPCVCSIRYIIEQITLFLSICIILLQLVILGLQLLRMS